MHGPAMRHALDQLAKAFERVAVPPSGIYVEHPATVADGTAYPGRG